MLCLLFNEIYMNMNNKKKYPAVERAELEEALENYIMKVMGYSVRNEYRRCVESGNPHSFPYYAAVRRWFNNLIQNFDYTKSRTLLDAIDEYGTDFYPTISKYPYVEKLIKGIKRLYSNDENDPNIVIDHKDKMYKISIVSNKNSEGMPVMVINNIDNLEKILKEYVETVCNTDNNYNKVFTEFGEGYKDQQISELLRWTVINASSVDALDMERYFEKYISFVSDTTFELYKHRPQQLGDILEDQLFLLERHSSCSYETPHYLSFMLNHRHVELPNIRLGIEDTGENKVAHIFSIQSSQNFRNPVEDPKINKEIREQLPKTPNFREFNPTHLFSLVLALGLLNGAGINEVVAYEYLPMRYQRFVNEARKSEDELHQYQHRLTNKYINTFFRLMEYTDDIDIISYPENLNNLKLRLNKDIVFNNDFLNQVYQIGYNQSHTLNNKYGRKLPKELKMKKN